MRPDEQTDIREALTIVEGQTVYMKEMGFAPQSCAAILKGVTRIMEVVNAPERRSKRAN